MMKLLCGEDLSPGSRDDKVMTWRGLKNEPVIVYVGSGRYPHQPLLGDVDFIHPLLE